MASWRPNRVLRPPPKANSVNGTAVMMAIVLPQVVTVVRRHLQEARAVLTKMAVIVGTSSGSGTVTAIPLVMETALSITAAKAMPVVSITGTATISHRATQIAILVQACSYTCPTSRRHVWILSLRPILEISHLHRVLTQGLSLPRPSMG